MTDQEIIEAIAEKVMGWTREAGPNGDWYDDPEFVGSAPPTEYYDWDPLRDVEACKQVREKLAERFMVSLYRFKEYAACTIERTSPPLYPEIYPEPVQEEFHHFEAETEERAVCLAALKAIGVKGTA